MPPSVSFPKTFRAFALGGLPLALDQAGAYLEETGCGLSDYQQLYRQHRNELLRKRGGLVADHPELVATTWSLSFQQAQEKHPAAADLLYLCAFLAPDVIPEEILTADASSLDPVLAAVTADSFQLNQALEALQAYSLIRRHPTEQTLSIHRLVQAVLQETLKEEEQHTWRERAVLAVEAAFPDVKYEEWPLGVQMLERMLTQALFATRLIEQYQMSNEEAARLLHETAYYLSVRARYAEAEPLYQRALRIWEEQLESERPDVPSSLLNLANLYNEQGQYEKAESLYQRTLCICERQLGPEHPSVAYSLNGLAGLYSKQGKYGKTKQFYRRALRIWKQQLGSEHPNVGYPLHNLANFYHEQGKYAEAESLYQQALQLWERNLGREHPNVIGPLHGLAVLYSKQGKYDEAEPLYQRALCIQEQQLGSEHPQAATIIHNFAGCLDTQGNSEKARIWYVSALAIQEQALGAQHPKTVKTRTRLIALLQTMGEHEEAAKLAAIQSEP